jgi:hypothetical protein
VGAAGSLEAILILISQLRDSRVSKYPILAKRRNEMIKSRYLSESHPERHIEDGFDRLEVKIALH